jgi:RNA recognition motif-containing protein
VDDKNFVIAHISYSTIDEIQAVIEFMNNMEIDPENIHVVASVGEFQKKRSENEYKKRAFNSNIYTALGVPESNIIQFEFEPGKIEQDGSWLSKNLTQVIGCNDALFKYSFDLKNTPCPGTEFPREERIGDYKDEEIIKI